LDVKLNGKGGPNPAHSLCPLTEPPHTDRMSLDTSAVLSAILSLETQLAALKAQLGVKSAAPSGKSAPKKELKEPKEKKERAPTEWLLFTKRIRSLLEDNGFDKKDLGGPALLSFCKVLKEENAELDSWEDADVLARRADWTVPERKKKSTSETSSVVSGGAAAAGEPKPKKVKKAKKSAPSDDEAAPASDAEESTASSQKKRGPKPLSEMSPEERAIAEARNKAAAEKRKATNAAKKAKEAAAEAPSSPIAAGLSNAAALPLPASPKSQSSVKTETSGFQKIRLDGRGYLVNFESGHAYFRNPDDSMGDWAGLFHKTGGGESKKAAWIDTTVRAPLSALEELD